MTIEAMTTDAPDAGALAERLRACCGEFLQAFVLGLPVGGQAQPWSAIRSGKRLAVLSGDRD
jgi:hypothetical protein